MGNLILSKGSGEAEMRSYFNAILELSKSDNEFPCNLDEVWMLVYSEKGKAVRALKENFIEGVDFKPLPKNGERSEKVFAIGIPPIEFLTAGSVVFIVRY